MSTQFLEILLVLNLGVSLASLWKMYSTPYMVMYLSDEPLKPDDE